VNTTVIIALKKMLFYYGFGISISLFIIGLIHLYSLIAENYFCYAKWDNILFTSLICGFPFGVAIWAFDTFKQTK
jgi:hypothetical protein